MKEQTPSTANADPFSGERLTSQTPKFVASHASRRIEWMSMLKKWWLAILIAAIAAVLIAQVPHKELYRSTATMLFKQGGEYVYREQFGDRNAVAGTRLDLRSAVNAEGKIFLSEDVLKETLARVGVDNYLNPASAKDEGFWATVRGLTGNLNNSGVNNEGARDEVEKSQQALGKIQRNLSVRFVDNSNILEISHLHEDPEIAKLALDESIAAFFKKRKEVYKESSAEVMRVKLNQVADQFADAEVNLKEFNESNEIYSIEEERRALLSQKLEADKQLNLASLEIVSLQVQQQSLNEQLVDIPETVNVYRDRQINDILTNARARMLELKLEEKKLQDKYLPKHQKIISVRTEIFKLQSTLDSEQEYTTKTIRSGRNALYDQVKSELLKTQADLSKLETRQNSLQSLIDSSDQRLRHLEEIEIAQRDKKMQYELLQQQYTSYHEEVDKAEMIDSLSQGIAASARIVQSASLPFAPIGITGAKRTLFSAILGVLGCLGFLVLMELLRRPVAGVVFTPVRTVAPEVPEQVLSSSRSVTPVPRQRQSNWDKDEVAKVFAAHQASQRGGEKP